MSRLQSVALGDVVDSVIDNRGRNPEYYAAQGHPIIESNIISDSRYPGKEDAKRYIDQNIHDSFIRQYLRRNDICMTLVGDVGDVCLAPSSDWVVIQNLIGLRTIDQVDSVFFYYFLKLIKPSIKKLNRGSVQPSVLQGDLLKLNVRIVKSTSQQKKIATVLSSLDDKIELNRKINAELEQMARTLYDYWFVQFDFPYANGKPYKSSGGKMAYNDQLKREIPAGWKVQDMYNNDLFDIIKPKIDKFAGEKQYIATADVDSLNISKGSPITYENRESRANMQPKEYTVWFAKMKASIKHILVGDYSKDLLQDAIFSTGFMGIQTSKEAFEYVALTVHRPYFELVKDANSNGATMAAIGNNDMKNIKLLVPSPDVITSFHEAVRPILQKIDLNRQQSQKLAEIRDWLLPMLMNGQVSVR